MKAIKTIFYLAAAWGMLSLGVACDKTVAPVAAIDLDGATASLSSSGIKVGSAQHVKHLVFTSAIAWSVGVEEAGGDIASWIEVFPGGGEGGSDSVDAEVVILANPKLTSRSATLSLISGDIVKTFKVEQEARSFIPAEAMALSEQNLVLHVGDSARLEAVFTPEDADLDKDIEWTSSNKSVATVKDGLVQGVAQGTAVITATYGSFSATCEVKVGKTPVSVTLNKTSLELTEQESEQLTATISPTGVLDEVQWTSSDISIATVKDGLVTAVHEGKAVITAIVGEQTAECEVTILHKEIEVESVTLKEHEVTVEQGGTLTLKATVAPVTADNKALTWSSSNPLIAPVDPETGVVTLLEAGEVTITATAKSGKSDSCKVTIVAKDGSHGEDLGDDVDVNPWN